MNGPCSPEYAGAHHEDPAMITVCTSCKRRFRIYAKQLSAAGGRVQCGFCGTQFNALEQLYDDQSLPGQSEDPSIETPFDARTHPVDDKPMSVPVQAPGPHVPEPPADYLAEDLLLPEPQPRSSWLAVTLWSSGVLLLLLSLAVQLAWFNRDRLLARYPQYVPQVKQLCVRYGCDLVRERNPDAIVLVNRDVRDHPRYSDILLVNITIENRSAGTQPYPGIQLTLFDSNGAVTGFRRLQPAEYLEPGTDIEGGMRARLPLHLVLEIAETTRKPVGFEFDFF